jgi:lysozyme
MKKIIGIIVLIALCPTLLLTLYVRWRQEGYLSYRDYEVKGVDVSSYQGEIDWPLLAGQDIRFAFIKATEGSGHTDPSFKKNFEEAGSAGLRIGAYHFFSFDSGGGTQADNYIAAVPKTSGMLPPVIDVELYGANVADPPDKETVHRELSVLLSRLETWYGAKPILYADESMYRTYIAGAFDGYDLWIRNTRSRPFPGFGRGWTFWQYTGSAVLDGYYGAEKHIDMNVFNGSLQQFEAYPESSK